MASPIKPKPKGKMTATMSQLLGAFDRGSIAPLEMQRETYATEPRKILPLEKQKKPKDEPKQFINIGAKEILGKRGITSPDIMYELLNCMGYDEEFQIIDEQVANAMVEYVDSLINWDGDVFSLPCFDEEAKKIETEMKIYRGREVPRKTIYTCFNCRSSDVTAEQKQTRSSDEAMTTFCRCNHCNKAWVDG